MSRIYLLVCSFSWLLNERLTYNLLTWSCKGNKFRVTAETEWAAMPWITLPARASSPLMYRSVPHPPSPQFLSNLPLTWQQPSHWAVRGYWWEHSLSPPRSLAHSVPCRPRPIKHRNQRKNSLMATCESRQSGFLLLQSTDHSWKAFVAQEATRKGRSDHSCDSSEQRGQVGCGSKWCI